MLISGSGQNNEFKLRNVWKNDGKLQEMLNICQNYTYLKYFEAIRHSIRKTEEQLGKTTERREIKEERT